MGDVSHPRYREYVPPLPHADARGLRGLPERWGQPIEESALDALEKRADGLVGALVKSGRAREAGELRRRLSLLRRMDDLHRHSENLEMLAGLYRALSVFACADAHDAPHGDALVWAQTGALDEDAPPPAHGPAFRETADLRNRAFRRVASAVAGLARDGRGWRGQRGS